MNLSSVRITLERLYSCMEEEFMDMVFPLRREKSGSDEEDRQRLAGLGKVRKQK